MYLIGILLFIAFMLGNIPSFLHFKEVYPEMLFRYGSGPEPSINLQAVEFYSKIISFTNFISMGVNIATGFFANRLYYNKVVREVSEISRKSESAQDLKNSACLAARGGIDINSVVIAIMVLAGIFFIVGRIIASAIY